MSWGNCKKRRAKFLYVDGPHQGGLRHEGRMTSTEPFGKRVILPLHRRFSKTPPPSKVTCVFVGPVRKVVSVSLAVDWIDRSQGDT